MITLTPFPTAILAVYLQKESTTALAAFGFNYVLISIAANGICSYAFKNGLIPEGERSQFHSFRLIYRYAIYYTALAFIICFFFPWIALFLYIILFTLFAMPRALAIKIEKIQARMRLKLKVILRPAANNV